jgi:hypothetical protein
MMAERFSRSVGLGGDGDEVAAIRDVERAFGVKLDYADAPSWLTAGDVFRSLRKALPADELSGPDLWNRFAAALCAQTGVDPSGIEQGSPLLSSSRLWVHVANSSAVTWIGAAAIILALVTWALV